jgi:hypothetical protein
MLPEGTRDACIVASVRGLVIELKEFGHVASQISFDFDKKTQGFVKLEKNLPERVNLGYTHFETAWFFSHDIHKTKQY